MALERTISGIIKPLIIRTDKDSHFTGALAQNAIEAENITGILTNSGTIVGVNLQSDQNLDWDIYFWAKDELDNTDLDLDECLGKVRFVASDGDQIAGAGQYYYDSATSSYAFRGIRYVDLDNTTELHVGLVNRNSTAKNAGATGEVVIRVILESDVTVNDLDN